MVSSSAPSKWNHTPLQTPFRPVGYWNPLQLLTARRRATMTLRGCEIEHVGLQIPQLLTIADEEGQREKGSRIQTCKQQNNCCWKYTTPSGCGFRQEKHNFVELKVQRRKTPGFSPNPKMQKEVTKKQPQRDRFGTQGLAITQIQRDDGCCWGGLHQKAEVSTCSVTLHTKQLRSIQT